MATDYETNFNWNLAPALDPCWILLDNVYGNDREVPVHVYGIGHFNRLQIGIRTADRTTAEKMILQRETFTDKMPRDLLSKVLGESYRYMGQVHLEPRIT